MDGVVLSWAAQVVRLAGCPDVEVLHACTHASSRKALPSWTGREVELLLAGVSATPYVWCVMFVSCLVTVCLGMLACCVASLSVANLSQPGQGLAGSVNLDALE